MKRQINRSYHTVSSSKMNVAVLRFGLHIVHMTSYWDLGLSEHSLSIVEKIHVRNVWDFLLDFFRPIHPAPTDADQHRQSPGYSTSLLRHSNGISISKNKLQQTPTGSDRGNTLIHLSMRCEMAFRRTIWCRRSQQTFHLLSIQSHCCLGEVIELIRRSHSWFCFPVD